MDAIYGGLDLVRNMNGDVSLNKKGGQLAGFRID